MADRAADVRLGYQRSWAGGLAAALVAARTDDLRRGVTTVGPHRDDLVVTIGALPSRTHASQGEQRSLALALRLAGHRWWPRPRGPRRCCCSTTCSPSSTTTVPQALLAALPEGQSLLTTAGVLPAAAQPALVVRIQDGTVLS